MQIYLEISRNAQHKQQQQRSAGFFWFCSPLQGNRTSEPDTGTGSPWDQLPIPLVQKTLVQIFPDQPDS